MSDEQIKVRAEGIANAFEQMKDRLRTYLINDKVILQPIKK